MLKLGTIYDTLFSVRGLNCNFNNITGRKYDKIEKSNVSTG